MKSLKYNFVALAVLSAIAVSAYAQNTEFRSIESISNSAPTQNALNEEEKLKKENRCFSNERSGKVQFNHGPEGNQIMKDRVSELCYLGYNLVYDPVTKTPVWVSQNMKNNTKVLSNFATFRRVDPNLAKDVPQATVDYGDEDMEAMSLAAMEDMDLKVGTGEEKGRAIEESLYYTNTIPVVPGFKKGIWGDVENMVRDWSKDRELSVVTGVLFDNLDQPALYGPSRIWIPTRLYKAVYEPKTGRSIAFVVPNVQVITNNVLSLNQGSEDYWQTLPKYAYNCKGVCSPNNFVTSVAEVEKAAGVKLFPNAVVGTKFDKIAPKYWGIN